MQRSLAKKKSVQIPKLKSLSESVARSGFNNSPQRQLQKTFVSLAQQKSQFIKKQVLLTSSFYVGPNYNQQTLQRQLENCSDLITYDQFLKIFQASQIARQEEMEFQYLSSLFKMFDFGDKGYIQDQDLNKVAEITGIPLNQEEVNQMLSLGSNIYKTTQMNQELQNEIQLPEDVVGDIEQELETHRSFSDKKKVRFEQFLRIMGQSVSFLI